MAYVPGSLETDPKKQNASLRSLNDGLTTAQGDIITNTTNIATLQTTVSALPGTIVSSVSTSGLATGGPITSTGTVTVTAASKSDQTTGTSNAVAVTPLHQQDHASAAKAWVAFNASGTILGSYNVTSVSRTAAGKFTVSFTTAFANTNYAAIVSSENSGNSTDALSPFVTTGTAKTASAISVFFLNAAGSAFVDPSVGHLVCFGAQ